MNEENTKLLLIQIEKETAILKMLTETVDRIADRLILLEQRVKMLDKLI